MIIGVIIDPSYFEQLFPQMHQLYILEFNEISNHRQSLEPFILSLIKCQSLRIVNYKSSQQDDKYVNFTEKMIN